MSREHKINTGYDLAVGLLKKGQGSLETLLKSARGQENGWLEFKADPFCRAERDGEKQDDYSWHILKAVIEFANTCGGCILIGVDDNGKSVPLLDKYSRDLQSLLFDKNKFSIRNPNPKNPNRVRIEVDNSQWNMLTELSIGRLDGDSVLVLLVKESEKLLSYEEDGQEKMLVRKTNCSVGAGSEQLKMSGIEGYIKNRPEIQPLREYYSSIPSPNDCFVGRLGELEELHRLLSEIPPRIPLIHGPAGTGKTELAFRYAETWADTYESCMYLRAENITGIPEGFRQILQDPQLVAKYGIEIPSGAVSLDKEFQIIRDALLNRGKGDILILFDNLENPGVLNPSEIRKYLTVPGGEKLHIYATTRRDDLQVTGNDTVHPFELKGLQKSEGLELLEKKRPCGSEAERKAAQELVEYLDGNAWALDLIGEDLKQRHPKYDDDYRDWLERIKKEPVKAFSEAGEQETVRIKHGCLDPVKMLEPTLKRLKPIARSFANTAALCNPDFIYTGWLKGVYLRKTKEEISVRQFNSAIMELKDAHVFNQRTEEGQEARVYSSGQEMFEVIKLHRLTRSVLLTQLGENLKKEQLVFRKYFLRELLNVLDSVNDDYSCVTASTAGGTSAGVAIGGVAAIAVPSIAATAGACIGAIPGFSHGKKEEPHSSSLPRNPGNFPSPVPAVLPNNTTRMLSKALGLNAFGTAEDGDKTKETTASWVKTCLGITAGLSTGMTTGLAAIATAGVGAGTVISTGAGAAGLAAAGSLLLGPLGLMASAAGLAGYLYLKKQSEDDALQNGQVPAPADYSSISENPVVLKQDIENTMETVNPSPEWMKIVPLFLSSFEEIRSDLDEEDLQCVRSFLEICCRKLSDTVVFSVLHHSKQEALGIGLLFRLCPVVTETLRDSGSENTYVTSVAVFYKNLINFRQIAKNDTEEKNRLDFCLEIFVRNAAKYPPRLSWKLDRELEEMSLAAGKKFKPLAEVHFPDPVFCE